MDYYYALLDSYQLLKQRKFKLTINEQEEGDDTDVIALIKSLGTGATPENPSQCTNEVEVFVSDPKATDTFTGRYCGSDGWAAFLLKGDQLNPNGNKNAEDMINKLRGGGGASTLTTTTRPPNPALQKAIAAAAKVWNGFVGGGKGELVGMDYQLSKFPGLKTTKGRIVRSLTSILSTRKNKPKGFGGDKPEGVVGSMMSTPCDIGSKGEELSEEEIALCEQNKLEASQSLEELGSIFTEFLEAGGKINSAMAARLQRLTPNLQITKFGIRFGEVFVFYKKGSSPETDVLRNVVGQLNDAIETYNEEWEEMEDKEGGVIPPVGWAESTGINRSRRGPAAEVLSKMSLLLMRLQSVMGSPQGDLTSRQFSKLKRDAVAKARKESLEIYKKAKHSKSGEDSTAESLRRMFQFGAEVAMGEKLIMDDDQWADVTHVEEVAVFLEKKGFDKDTVSELLKAAGAQVGRAIVLLAYTARDFDRNLFGKSIPDDLAHLGAVGSSDLGEKTDIMPVWNTENEDDCNRISDHYKSFISDSQRDHYKLGCGSKGVGEDALVGWQGETTDEKTGVVTPARCVAPMELKTLDNLQSKKGFGQSSNGRASTVLSNCKGGKVNQEGETKNTKDFLDVHDERMKDCGVSTEGACDFATSIESKIAGARALLDPSLTHMPGKDIDALDYDLEDEEGNPIEKPAEEGDRGMPITLEMRVSVLQKWRSNKTNGAGELTDENRDRYDAAMRVIRQEKLQPGDEEEASKVTEQLFQYSLAHNTPEGEPLTDEAQDYILSRLHLGAGSTVETAKVGRGLEDNEQTFGLNNAEVMGCVGGVKKGDYTIVRSGNTYNIVDKKGTIRMFISAERGGFEIGGGKPTGNEVPKEGPRSQWQENTDKSSKEMLVEFLKGQQDLLDKLLKP